MDRRYPVLLGVLLCVGLSAQEPLRLEWDQPAITLDEAQSFVYRMYVDNAVSGVVLSGVTCEWRGSNQLFVCYVPLPTFTPGNHRLQLTAANNGGESFKSAPLDFVYGVPGPAAPTGLRIVRQ